MPQTTDSPPQPESRGPLALKDGRPAARGMQCHVYFHPDSEAFLVKVPLHPAQLNEPWYKRLRSRYGAARREMAEYTALRSRAPADLDLIERVTGWAATDIGQGLVVEALRDRSGRLAPTLQRLARQGKFDARLSDKLERFIARLVEGPLIAHDLKARNIVLAHDAATGRERLVLIDGIGKRPDFPLDGLIPALDRFNKRRRAKKLRAEIDSMIPRSEQ